jgi:hypothetical protein
MTEEEALAKIESSGGVDGLKAMGRDTVQEIAEAIYSPDMVAVNNFVADVFEEERPAVLLPHDTVEGVNDGT